MIKRWWVLGLLGLIAIALILTEPYTHLFHRLADEVLYNNTRHYLPCAALPQLGEVQETIEQHAADIARIQAISPDQVEVLVDSLTCPGKGSVVIYYASRAEGEQIREILGDRTFYGVPLDLINR